MRRLSDRATRGIVEFGNLKVPCALGRSGVVARKREGDGGTPLGRFAMVEVLFNPVAAGRPATRLPVRAIGVDDGWCDDPQDRNYNRFVRHPYGACAERLWRDDGIYDVVVVLDHNRLPRVRGKGSAIFMHVARAGYTPTEGCIALALADLKRILASARSDTRVIIRS